MDENIPYRRKYPVNQVYANSAQEELNQMHIMMLRPIEERKWRSRISIYVLATPFQQKPIKFKFN